ncbi:hypothetical protein BHE74_00029263 [Ensete ventricosum]|nr:hypothetical protein GW17_00027459 [Ensete ventricosum]RWW63551.1 hypothetical protein BHE74_00029263 [Ensete ventricosum]
MTTLSSLPMAKKTTTFLLLNLFLVALSTLTTAAVSPAVFVFGDSTVDVGNNNFLPGDAPKVNFPPWGIDYPGGTPTGRFSNGFNYADYIGMHYFGSSIEDFEQVAGNLTERLGKKSAAVFLDKSLFYLSVGSNDVLTLVEVPSYGCYEDLNNFSLRFKTATKALLEELSMSLKGFQYSFGDSYEMVTKIFSHPQEYGFTDVKAACCGSGRLNAESACLPNSTVCSNRGQYGFWDQSHPTQALYKTIVQLSLYGPPVFANPVNIHHLVKG